MATADVVFVCQASSSGTRPSEGAPSAPCSRAQTIARVGTTALRWGLTWVSTSVSWMAFRFARSCLCSSTLSMPSLMESHFKVPHHFWSFAGVTSSVTAWFMVHEVPDVARRSGEVLEADLAHALIGQAVCSDGAEPGIAK